MNGGTTFKARCAAHCHTSDNSFGWNSTKRQRHNRTRRHFRPPHPSRWVDTARSCAPIEFGAAAPPCQGPGPLAKACQGAVSDGHSYLLNDNDKMPARA
jgi:hypothetical protein